MSEFGKLVEFRQVFDFGLANSCTKVQPQLGPGCTKECLVGLNVGRINVDKRVGAVGKSFKDAGLIVRGTDEGSKLHVVKNDPSALVS